MLRCRRSRVTLVAIAVCLAGTSLAVAGKWSPDEFRGPAYCKLRIVNHEDGKATEIVQSLDVEATDRKDEEGNALFRLTTTTQSHVKEGDLSGMGTMLGGTPLLAMLPALMFGNPMFGAMLGQMDLEVGEKMSFFGVGYAKVVARETVAGVEGYRCELYTKQGDEDVRSAELVVHPDVTLPLRSRTYEDGKVRLDVEMLEYRKH